MAETNAPQPDHPLVSSLDATFTGDGGNAPALAGWLEYLAHPEMNTGPRVLEWLDGTALESGGRPDPDTGYVVERSALRDLPLDRFFAHADVLSGQQVGSLTEGGEISSALALGKTFDLLEEVRFKKPKYSDSPRKHSADVWAADIGVFIDGAVKRENWDDGAGDNARDRYAQMVQWYEDHRDPALLEMNTFLVKFAAIIIKARTDINELMGKFVQTLEKRTAQDSMDGLTFLLSALEKILDTALNPPKTVHDAAMLMKDELKEVVGLVTKQPEKTGDSGFGMDTSDTRLGFYRMFESFIAAGDKVCWEASGAIAKLITDRENGLLFVRNNWVHAPKWSH